MNTFDVDEIKNKINDVICDLGGDNGNGNSNVIKTLDINPSKRMNKIVDILNDDDIFNVIREVDDKKYPPWIKLSKEDKKKKLQELFGHNKQYEDDLKDALSQMIDNNKLRLKKEISYDKNNQCILKIHLIEYNKQMQKWQFIDKNSKELKQKQINKKIRGMFV